MSTLLLKKAYTDIQTHVRTQDPAVQQDRPAANGQQRSRKSRLHILPKSWRKTCCRRFCLHFGACCFVEDLKPRAESLGPDPPSPIKPTCKGTITSAFEASMSIAGHLGARKPQTPYRLTWFCGLIYIYIYIYLYTHTYIYTHTIIFIESSYREREREREIYIYI